MPQEQYILTNEQISNIPLPSEDLRQQIETYTMPYRELMAYYKCALMEVETKFRVLSEELSLQYDRNPIETIKTRIKSLDSIVKKLERKNLPIETRSIEQNIFDVAGIRVICAFPSDIYELSQAFLRQDDITLIEQKDYIKHPKESGYRSLHLIVEIPIFLHDEKKPMKVEVQFRTISMDWWASLEHKIRYKKNVCITDEIVKELYECAQTAAELDERMEKIHQAVSSDG